MGAGARECAIAHKIYKDPLLETLFVDSWNPGFPGSVTYLKNIYDVYLDLVIVGPEKPLAEGIANKFMLMGTPVFGPTRQAAFLETSKLFAKSIMTEAGIPTADFAMFEGPTRFMEAEKAIVGPCVVKVDGLAGGKGVYVCDSKEEAIAAVKDIGTGKYGSSGAKILIEEKLTGPEVSVFAICDGRHSIMLPTCRDYKRRYSGNKGPNTGGMGAISPVPGLGKDFLRDIQRAVVTPLLLKMKSIGREFRGVLYTGLMLTEQGPKVLEFNVRFGDPECQALMMLLDERLLPVMYDAAVGNMPKRKMTTVGKSVCCVVLCNKDYPVKGSQDERIEIEEGCFDSIYYSGVDFGEDLKLITNGGRIMTVCSFGDNIAEAREKVYNNIGSVQFEGMDFRNDIGGDCVTV